MTTREWRVATRKKDASTLSGWDVGYQPMLFREAQARAEQYNRKYPAYQHMPIRVTADGEMSKETRKLVSAR